MFPKTNSRCFRHGRVHSLWEHLEGTAKLAAGFAGEVRGGEWLNR